jgi:metal-responsive CopG/Arc/MetJ family transcriptional regulator
MSSAQMTDRRKRIRTTLSLPVDLRERIERAIARGTAPNQNRLIVQAVESYLTQQEETWIDAQFAEMADDAAYQTLQSQIAAEFTLSDWEALQSNEAQP